MPQYKDFTPEVEHFPHLIPFLPSIPQVIETRLETREKMTSWIRKNKVDVISIETLSFKYGKGLIQTEARFRVWYR